MKFPYEDIVNRPRHRSKKRTPMPEADRAAQFSPFAALTGYEEVIREAGRYTAEKRELDENEKEQLDKALRFLCENRKDYRGIFTCFAADEKKQGGSYVHLAGKIRRMDSLRQELQLTDGRRIKIEDISEITWIRDPAGPEEL